MITEKENVFVDKLIKRLDKATKKLKKTEEGKDFLKLMEKGQKLILKSRDVV